MYHRVVLQSHLVRTNHPNLPREWYPVPYGTYQPSNVSRDNHRPIIRRLTHNTRRAKRKWCDAAAERKPAVLTGAEMDLPQKKKRISHGLTNSQPSSRETAPSSSTNGQAGGFMEGSILRITMRNFLWETHSLYTSKCLALSRFSNFAFITGFWTLILN